MSIIEGQSLDIKDSVLESFNRIFEQTKPAMPLKDKLEFGKYMALTLIAFASVGLIIGFLISLLI